MMWSVFPGYQLLWITPSVFSNVYDVVIDNTGDTDNIINVRDTEGLIQSN
jgi:hypothetical protein